MCGEQTMWGGERGTAAEAAPRANTTTTKKRIRKQIKIENK